MFVCGDCGSAWPSPGACTVCGGFLAPVGDDVLLGQMVGAYRVARLLGVGGMGRVYKGVHPQIGSRVAIKVLSRECTDRRELVERFFAEARAVNVANHENIVNVLDLSVLPDARPYIVMEYLDGASLASLIEDARQRGTPLALGGVARLTAEVLEALAAAHAKGIVHRDLKPDNIFVLNSGRVKVLDFGVAKLRPELGGSATHTGSLLGTPYYMSPEQASSRPVDARADIYAMGVILFECATLTKPFVAAALYDLLKMHVEQPPPSPRSLRRDLPADVEQVILTALAKSPDQRFGSARAMSAALQHATRALPPEQWTTLTPGEGARVNAPWQPTPPASWAHAPHVSPSTVSSGQVSGKVTESQPPRAPRRGAWIAVGALALAGGGVAVGVLATRPNATQDQVADHSPDHPASPGPTPTVVSPEPPPAPPQPPTEVPVPGPPPPAWTDKLSDADTAAILAELAMVPPDARKSLPPALSALLTKYSDASKIPKAELNRALGKTVAQLPGVSMDVAKQVNDALAGIDEPPPAQKPLPGRLIANHSVTIPGFDPGHANTDAIVKLAMAEAVREVPDAQLMRLDLDNVRSDGTADLTAPAGIGEATLFVHFRSASHVPAKGRKPPGSSCELGLLVSSSGGEMLSPPMCGQDAAGPPRCTVRQIWKKALVKHPSLSDAVATIHYVVNLVSHKVVWEFAVGDGDNRLASEMFPDDC